jgi:formate dehydrogenase subunit delta
MSGVTQLVAMVNDIAAFFTAKTNNDVAVAGVVNHLQKFWIRRMCRKLAASIDVCGDDLTPLIALARAALEQLALRDTA